MCRGRALSCRPEKVDGGFFSGTHLFYTIQIANTEIRVKRKPQEFAWFRDCVAREFPLSFVPALVYPESKPNDADYTSKQKTNFEVGGL